MERYEAYKDSGVEWVGEIPQEWRVSTIGRIGQLGRGRVISNVEINENPGNYPVYSSQTKDGGVMGYLGVYDFEGEYVLWTTDGANAGTVTRRVGQFNCTNVCGTLQPKNWNEIDLRFLPYFLNLGTRFSVRLDINPKLMNGMMAKVPLVLPPKDEQTAIANFLDRKTAEIDALIAQKERLLELYEEEKTVIINHAVTKGLDPNAELKDSGVEWLSKIPVGWEVKKLKYTAYLKSGNNLTSDQIKEDGVYPVYGGNGLRGYYHGFTHEGEFVLIGRQGALCGNINYPTNKFWATEHAVVVEPLSEYKFVWMGELLRIMNLNQYSVAAAQPGLSVEAICNLFIPWLLLEEQESIVEYIEAETARIDAKIAKTQRIIELQKEYRTALISEVVTGKIKVPESSTQEASA